MQEELLAQADYAGKTLEDWLRNGFFEQHCALFHHRPFIWHIWDGHKSGFSALVNYHKLTHANLEKLTYAYLGDWIRRQQAAVDAGEAGSDARLQAAKQLQAAPQAHPRRRAALRPLRPLEAALKTSHRLAPRHQRRRADEHPPLPARHPGGRSSASASNIKWEKDRGKEPVRDKKEFPWFWGWDEEKQDFAGVGKEPDGNRWNDCHYTNEFKKRAREANKTR